MLPREAYDVLECQCTLCFNHGQSEDKETNDKGVDISITVPATGTHDTTVCQANTTLAQTNGTTSETIAITNVRCSPVIPLHRRGEPIVIDDNKIVWGICNENIARGEDGGHVISDGCKCNFDYHYRCLLRM